MFKNAIYETPMTTQAANECFKNIVAVNSYRSDVSFLSTLRSLVAPRMADGDRIVLKFDSSTYTKEVIRENSVRTVLEAVVAREITRSNDCGYIIVHNFNSDAQDDNYANLELMKASFEENFDGWHRIEKITDFFRKSFYVLCFINPERKCVYLFVERMDFQRLHYLQCAIFAFMPWYFDPQKGVTESEMALINSLREKSSTKYMNCTSEIAKQYDFRQYKIRSLLGDFESRSLRQECEAIKSNMDDNVSSINRLNSQIGQYLASNAELGIRLLGLEAKIAEGSSESEIMEYFLSNKNIEIEEVSGDTLTFSCKGYVTYFDEEIAKRAIDNKSSFVYYMGTESLDRYIRREDMKRLMYALFIDQKIRLKMCASYRFSLGRNVSAMQDRRFGYEFNDCMPNPHINHFGCMGNYSRTINNMLTENNYIGAIEQCVASCKSLNFADPPVMKVFMGTMYGTTGYNNCCIELPDGQIVTPKGAINWLMAQDESNKQESEEVADE